MKSETEIRKKVIELKKSIDDLYHQLGKVQVWNASNDLVCELCEALVMKKIDEIFSNEWVLGE